MKSLKEFSLAKRLTEIQKKEITQFFKNGKNIDLLSREFNCSKLTIIRTLKKDLGDVIYKDLSMKNRKSIQEIINEEIENNIDFGFVLNNNYYEMVSDLQFWKQPIPPDVFLEKLYQKYSLYKVIDGVQEQGFNTDLIDYNSENGCIELQVSRYNV